MEILTVKVSHLEEDATEEAANDEDESNIVQVDKTGVINRDIWDGPE